MVWSNEERWGGGRWGGTIDGLPIPPDPIEVSKLRNKLFSVCTDVFIGVLVVETPPDMNSCRAAAAAAAATARSGSIDWCIYLDVMWI